MKISICIPVYNGSKTIGNLVDEVSRSLKGKKIEFVLVNDSSPDDSEEVCLRIAEKRKNVKFISLRKNSGEHNAVMCALNHMTGDVAVIIDDDFQNPPEEIIKLIEGIQQGFDVVYSRYSNKKHHVFRNLGSSFNNLVSTWLLEKPYDLYLSSFKAIRREVVDEIIKYQGPFPYIDGLILRTTNNISTVLVRHDARVEGKSNYTIKKLISLWLNMFINFSIKPMRVFTSFGIMTTIAGIFFVIYVLSYALFFPGEDYGWPSLIISLFFFSGIQLIFLGLIGEYLGKMYLTSTGTPQWVIRKKKL